MKNLLFTIILIPFVSIAFDAAAQDCTDYHQYHCIYGDYTFFYSRQSKSALFRKGQSSELKVIAYGGEDYYVSVCAHRKFGNIQLRILEDNEQRNLIYDNAKDNYSESITFSNAITRNLIIEVTVPEGDGRDLSDRRCVGVVIEFRKTQASGKK
jgi:hypothetical protein